MHEIDLHNKTVVEALETFISLYNNYLLGNNKSPIKIIHGYGSNGLGGKIRQRLREFLELQNSNLSYKFGEDIDNNEGYTIVYPKQKIADLSNLLFSQILEYCKTPKTIDKISGEFRSYGTSTINSAIKSLEKLNLLKSAFKGKYKVYTSI